MKRLVLVFNPRSSNFAAVDREVLTPIRRLKGWLITKFEVDDTNVDENAARLAKVLKADDLVIAAGGDGTATIAMNAIMLSPQGEQVRFAVLGYGNFNDMSRSFGQLTLAEILRSQKTAAAYPLECRIDDQHWRYAMCYVTIGMFAAACAVFDAPKVRRHLRGHRRKQLIFSIRTLAGWWRRHHHDHFLPEFILNDQTHSNISDYVAVNAPSMARVMRSEAWFRQPATFLSTVGNLTTLRGLCRIILPAIFRQVPGASTTADSLRLAQPAKVMIQAEGEYAKVPIQSKIEITKSPRAIQIVTK